MKVEIGPLTRIEGHLNVKTTVENNVVVDARCEGEMFRGFEAILRGRSPLDAQQITQRICGVCPYAHGIASSRAQEAAYGLTPTPNGRIMHNLIEGANHLYDYLLHFYQLCALDFVDITAIAAYQGRDADLLKLRDWVKSELASGKAYPAAPFLPRLSGTYIKDAEINIGAIKHYLVAMDIQKKANQASAIFGGKFPHAASIFPGGCSQEARVDFILAYRDLIIETRDFIHQAYLPDIVGVAAAFPSYWNIGVSKGGFLSYGMLPLGVERDAKRFFASGVLLDPAGSPAPVNFEKITEDVGNSRYSSASGLKVRDGVLSPDPKKGYSWIKAPRYEGHVVEVGPSARVLIDYKQGNNPAVKKLVEQYAGLAGITPLQLNSVLGRHLCRGICAAVIADFLIEECERLTPGEPSMPDLQIPKTGEGFGATEASRGALLHYIRLEDGKVGKYECVVPTTWNCSPRDDRDQPGPMESALIGTHVEKPEEQIESSRIVHSFDPCIACAVH
jgi:ferredoxin hydrogenase large subunit/hydrogenase large subunit